MATIKIDKPLVLIGMMGSGKSIIAEELASKLNKGWADSDRIIEERAGKTIAEIVFQDGIDVLRQKEIDLAQELLGGKIIYPIIALGGGGFLQQPIRDLCTKNATTIWLQVGLETLHERFQNTPQERKCPLLLEEGRDPIVILKELLEKREPVYKNADIIIPEDTIQNVTNQIISHLQEKKSNKSFII